ncbi:MAG: CPBP family intramembrane metalloprotease [Defluviitaleaceae bacterium]|nr:CPBP family intramembrane metalloprotease [Defluviitaleaceae bacterium]
MNCKKDIVRWAVSLFLGMLVLFWRVVLPTNIDITMSLIIIVVILDLILTASVIVLNKKELIAAFTKKFTLRDIGKIPLIIIVDLVIVALLISLVSFGGVPLVDLMGDAPASLIASEFLEVFAIGAFMSMVMFAPIWEEIVFRLAGKNLLKNGILFVVVTSCLFAFIHTANFSIIDNFFYLVSGAIYAVAYLIFKDIRILMATHFIWNLVSFFLG